METKNKFSVHGRLKSFIYAFRGIACFFQTQHNSWIQIATAVLVLLVGFLFDVAIYEWCLLVIAIRIVLISEIINTSIEYLTNIVSPDYNKEAGKVKDLTAGAVLVSAIVAALIGCFVFIPHFLK